MERNPNNDLLIRGKTVAAMREKARSFRKMAREADNDHNMATFYGMAAAYEDAAEEIKFADPVEGKPVTYAYWKLCVERGVRYWRCSECNERHDHIPSGDYCKDCGARVLCKDSYDQLPVGYIRRSYTVHCF